MVATEIIPKGVEGARGGEKFYFGDGETSRAHRRDAEYAEKGKGERFYTECTEEKRRTQRKKERKRKRARERERERKKERKKDPPAAGPAG